jgi:type II secretory pathway pseudopilin PulG
MNYPPDDSNTPQQPDISYPASQPNPNLNYSSEEPLPPPQPKKKANSCLIVTVVVGVIILALVVCGIIGNSNSQSITFSQDATATADAANAGAATDTPQPTNTPAPTDTPVPIPTISSAQLEKEYKALTVSTTVGNLDKDGNNDKGKDVHFTCQIVGFVKDNTGNTAGANVDDPNSSGVVQVGFPSGTDLSQLNEGDTLVVWGTDDGTFSGTNAFGGTVQEVGITAQYMSDKTTNYQTH